MKEKFKFHIGTGITSIVMVFIALCLTIFAILSYNSARSDYALSKEACDNVYNYYQIRNKTVREIADINELVMNIKQNTTSGDYKSSIAEAVGNAGYEIDDNDIITVNIDISGKQKLVVKLEISSYESSNGISIINSYISTTGGEYNSQGVSLITE
ncbi:MAG: hypothetical protein K2J91_00180 [Lachnospiraceae bacterium]|nr:hypothetical protein [Lachnospiraceae bacterium]